MKIILVEDDHFQAEEIAEALMETFPNVELETIDSEHGFYSKLDGLKENPPDVIIMDVMLRWAHPSGTMPQAPEEVLTEKHYRAGLRCLKLMAEQRVARGAKIILYTVLQPVDIESDIKALPLNVTYLVKESNFNQFIRTIRGFMFSA